MDKETTQVGTSSKEQVNYYQILECDETASASELKRNYQKLIKKYHPDKQTVLSSSSEKFIAIDKAYKTLIDENSRKQYDATILRSCFDEELLIHMELVRDDLCFDKDGVAYYSCRCGEHFTIQEKELNQDGLILECFQCSNNILIK